MESKIKKLIDSYKQMLKESYEFVEKTKGTKRWIWLSKAATVEDMISDLEDVLK